jgi:hypothetical protein
MLPAQSAYKSPNYPDTGQITSNQLSYPRARRANPFPPAEEVVEDGEGSRAASEYSPVPYTQTARSYTPRSPPSHPVPPLPPDQQREFEATTSKTRATGKHIGEVEVHAPKPATHKSPMGVVNRPSDPLSATWDKVMGGPKGPPARYPTGYPHPHAFDQIIFDEGSHLLARNASPSLPAEEEVATTSKTHAMGEHIREAKGHAPKPTAHKTPMPVVGHSVSHTDLSPVPDPLSAIWYKVKDGPKGDSVDRRIDILGANETARSAGF